MIKLPVSLKTMFSRQSDNLGLNNSSTHRTKYAFIQSHIDKPNNSFHLK